MTTLFVILISDEVTSRVAIKASLLDLFTRILPVPFFISSSKVTVRLSLGGTLNALSKGDIAVTVGAVVSSVVNVQLVLLLNPVQPFELKSSKPAIGTRIYISVF